MQVNKSKDFTKPKSGHEQKRDTAAATPVRHEERHRDSKDKAVNTDPARDDAAHVAVK
jgi:hypothetical protein